MFDWTFYRECLKDLLVADLPIHLNPPLPKSISTDSRTIEPGGWFLPLSGSNFDGHTFINEALERGAIGYFCSDASSKKDKNFIAVKDTLLAYQKIAKAWRQRFPKLKILAITGSVGKTTVKEMTGLILKESGSTLPFNGNFNNEVGVPKTISCLEDSHQFAIIELGARKQGDIAVLVDIVDPNVVGCLNVGSSHIAIFGNQSQIYATKLEIFRNSRPETIKIAPSGDPLIFKAAKESGSKVITFGTSSQSDLCIQNVFWRYDGGMDILLKTESEKETISIPFAHESYPLNVASACALALGVGISLKSVKKPLSSFTGIKGRYKVHRKENLIIIDDTYNASPESMRLGLASLARSFPQQRKVVVLGDMLELGEIADDAHKELGVICAQNVKPTSLITVGEKAKIIGQTAVKYDFLEKYIHFNTVDDLLNANLPFRKMGDVIYAKASNSIKLNKIIDDLLK